MSFSTSISAYSEDEISGEDDQGRSHGRGGGVMRNRKRRTLNLNESLLFPQLLGALEPWQRVATVPQLSSPFDMSESGEKLDDPESEEALVDDQETDVNGPSIQEVDFQIEQGQEEESSGPQETRAFLCPVADCNRTYRYSKPCPRLRQSHLISALSRGVFA